LKEAIVNVIGANELKIRFGLGRINAKPDSKDIGDGNDQEETIDAFRCFQTGICDLKATFLDIRKERFGGKALFVLGFSSFEVGCRGDKV
jgi:hypothetical protein